MKVIQVPFGFYPDPVGGTEIYVERLAGRLDDHGVEVVIAAPGGRSGSYRHDGLRVRRFAVAPTVDDVRDLYGEGDRVAARAFGEILDSERPELVHLHAFTRGVSLRLVREAKARRAPVVFTYHTPTVSCQRGTLMRWGSEVCSGQLDAGLCARCTLHGLGLPRPLAEIAGRLPAAAGSLAAAMLPSGSLATALRMRELVATRHTACRALLHETDRVVALCQWVWDLLVLNGVHPAKITLSRQGVNGESLIPDRTASSQRTGPVRVAFLGRLDPTKGAHVLISALRSAVDLPVTLDLYGIVHGEAEAMYLARLRELAAGDPRIRFRDAISASAVVACLEDHDAMAVPSQWLETGPLVVLEALAAGTPVVGSRLGGVAELIEDGVNGLLVEAGAPEAWRRALQRLCSDPELLVHLRKGIRPPRTMATVAAEMHELYRAILRTRSRHPDATMPA